MKRYKVLGGGWGEGYKEGDIIYAEEHAMAVRLQKNEVEPYEEVSLQAAPEVMMPVNKRKTRRKK